MQPGRNPMRDADEAGSSGAGAGADGARGVVQTPRPARLLLLRAGAAPHPARLLLLLSGAQASAGASRGVVETAEDVDRDPQHKRQKAPVSSDSCEIPKGFNDAVVDDVSKSHGKNSEEVEIKMDLSVDLLHLVFSFLGQRDLCRAGATCKLWQSVSKHGDLWKHLNLENTTISKQNFVAICQRYQNITELNMCGIFNADLLVLEAIVFLRFFKNVYSPFLCYHHLVFFHVTFNKLCFSRCLRTLTMGKYVLRESFFQAFSDCPLLTTLSISHALLGMGFQEITVQHDGLRELHIVKCGAYRISIRCSQLRTLSLRRTGITHLLLNCPQLNELDLHSCNKLGDIAIRQVVTACPLLASLDLSSCTCVTDETLREIADSCPNLSVLDASNCPTISLESVRLPMLVDLKLLGCVAINSASMTAISCSRVLQVLQLDNCSLLTSVSLDLPHLRTISLVHLHKCTDLNLRSPVLSHINVSRCCALNRTSITSNALQKLFLQKQENLASLSLQCENLVDVDLSDCGSLANAVCEVFSDGGCPILRSLALDNCYSLSNVELSNSSLVNLSLAGCHAMVSLKLSCPNLQKVKLDGCDSLKDAAFCPVGLESLNLGICSKLSVLHIEGRNMSQLELKGCGVLSQASINCPCLISLDATFCRQFMDGSLSQVVVACPLIEHLVLSLCQSISIHRLSYLNCLQKLTLLDLSYTLLINLQPVFEACSQLKVLKLSACKFLSDSSLDAVYRDGALPMLCELDLSYSSIGRTAIEQLLACCTNLVNVILNGCTNLHEIVCRSNACSSTDLPASVCQPNSIPINNQDTSRGSEHLLELLNCTGCPKIKKVVIPSTANYLHLSKVNLNLSTSLKEVDLTCSNLCYLNLSNCSSLEILKLNCPRLTNLQLLACSRLQQEELESAICLCNMLEILNVHSCPKINAQDFGRIRTVCPSLKHIAGGLIT